MSGDVQPRKRKDKKRRKDSEDSPTSRGQNDDITLHVHKDHGLGGGICAKIVFFVLFSALIVLIGLIIKENQGLTDLDKAEESRFAQMFEGWVDQSPDDHHEEEHLVEYSDDHDDHEEHDEEELEHSEADEEEEEVELDEVSEEQDHEELAETEEEEDKTEEDQEEDDEQEVEESEQKSEEETVEDVELSAEKSNEEDADENEGSEEASKHDDVEAEDEIENEENEIEGEKPEKGDDNEEEKSGENEQVQAEEVEEEPEATQGAVKEVKDTGEAESDSDDRQSENDYELSNITNKEDLEIRDELDKGHQALKENNPAYANQIFAKLVERFPKSPRSLYGQARALEELADQQRSNTLLQQAISLYVKLLFEYKNVPDALYIMAADRCIEKSRFLGQFGKAVMVHQKLIERFPNNKKYQNGLVVTYLTVNRVEDARNLLKNMLSKWPNDGFALVHYGFILKTTDYNLEAGINYLSKGIKTKDPGVIDGRFFFHLGDALDRLGRKDEAQKVYEEGVQNNLFLSKYQRSLYNVPRLTGKPWWEKNELPYLDLIRSLEKNWKKIRSEGLAILNEKGYFEDESENLKDTGDWKQFEIFARGRKKYANCKKCPYTCSLVENVHDASGCTRGQIKFSVMHPGTHVWPHCGPTNCRLRMHLGLKVPPGTFIRVAEATRSWKEGDVIIFDDSFEHEVWHNGTELRLVLIVDVWHPELTAKEKRNLRPI